MLIDTHCHLTYDEFSADLPGVLERAAAAGVARCVTIATDIADAQRALRLSAAHRQISFAAGIHPHEAGKVSADDLQALRELHEGGWSSARGAAAPVAVGETGLDFHYDFAPREVQERVFEAQLQLAVDVGRPVILHARRAEERVADMLRAFPALAGRCVFHCYSAAPQLARRLLDEGHWLSFTGVATFKNADAIRETVRFVPADRMMVETDAPFMSPEPVRKVRPCEPAFVAHTAERLAQERGVSAAALARTTTENAIRFFGLPQEAA